MAVRRLTKPDHWQLIISQGRNQKQIVVAFQGSELEARAAEREIRGIAVTGAATVADLLPAYLEWYKTNKLQRSYDELNDTYICESDSVQAYGKNGRTITTHENETIKIEGEYYLQDYSNPLCDSNY